jgi:hypothetical protein
MVRRVDLINRQPCLLADLTEYRARRGIVATVRRLHSRGISVPLAILLVLGLV